MDNFIPLTTIKCFKGYLYVYCNTAQVLDNSKLKTIITDRKVGKNPRIIGMLGKLVSRDKTDGL
jgi:hypothetical protein